jgi:hypothetical protein
MMRLREVKNQIAMDHEVYDQPSKNSLLPLAAIEIRQAKPGGTDHLVAADNTLYSSKNEVGTKTKGVKRKSLSLHQEPRRMARYAQALALEQQRDGASGQSISATTRFAASATHRATLLAYKLRHDATSISKSNQACPAHDLEGENLTTRHVFARRLVKKCGHD